jgi:hypothetical protein
MRIMVTVAAMTPPYQVNPAVLSAWCPRFAAVLGDVVQLRAREPDHGGGENDRLRVLGVPAKPAELTCQNPCGDQRRQGLAGAVRGHRNAEDLEQDGVHSASGSQRA